MPETGVPVVGAGVAPFDVGEAAPAAGVVVPEAGAGVVVSDPLWPAALLVVAGATVATGVGGGPLGAPVPNRAAPPPNTTSRTADRA